MSQGTTDINSATDLRAAKSAESQTNETDSRSNRDLRAVTLDSMAPDTPASTAPVDAEPEFIKRLDKVEKQNFRMKLALVVLVMIVGYLGFEQIVTDSTIIRQTLMESRELKLLDNNGNARLFLRMYSRVPVLQLLDSHGKPRMSLGMRFDDTPFIDLSDKTGRTRATLELNENDEPALRLLDENGEPTFKIN